MFRKIYVAIFSFIAGVLLLPPHIYHSELLPTPSDRFRVGFGRANIDEGLSAFRAWLRRNG
ncbi:hypothetical protein [Kiloniella laminariae]|uniref:hypothetical protein n=1 Tax=Kiloniella laminariae TaxID=454162 RepID=UPI001B7FADB4|nr:hypothetical protein [Kiloniella laminariae]